MQMVSGEPVGLGGWPKDRMRLVPDAFPTEFVEPTRREEIARIVRSALANPDAVVQGFCGTWPVFESLGVTDALTRDVRRRGAVRMLLPRSALTAGMHLRHLTTLCTRGVDIRLSQSDVPNLLVVGADVITVDTRPEAMLRLFHLHSEPLSRILLGLHDALWSHAVDLASAHRAAALRADGIRAQVLAHLGSGVLDDTAAREMDISVRTYRRHVARLLSDLTVTSRFQAGARAAELGLTTADPAREDG